MGIGLGNGGKKKITKNPNPQDLAGGIHSKGGNRTEGRRGGRSQKGGETREKAKGVCRGGQIGVSGTMREEKKIGVKERGGGGSG